MTRAQMRRPISRSGLPVVLSRTGSSCGPRRAAACSLPPRSCSPWQTSTRHSSGGTKRSPRHTGWARSSPCRRQDLPGADVPVSRRASGGGTRGPRGSRRLPDVRPRPRRRLPAQYLADALIEQGKLDEAAEVLPGGAFEDDADTAHAHWFLDSRARFRLVSGDLRRGLDEMFAVGRSFEAVGGRNPAFVPSWQSQAAAALLLLGEQDDARPLAEEGLYRPAAGPRRGRSAELCGSRASSRAVSEGSASSRRRPQRSMDRLRSSSMRKRGPSWARPFAGRTVAQRRASISAERSSSRRSAGRRLSGSAPRPSFSRPARGLGASPCAGPSRLHRASGGLPRWRPKA